MRTSDVTWGPVVPGAARHGVVPLKPTWQKWMMWWFIVTDGLLFAGLLGSYGYTRILGSNWPDRSAVFSLRYIAAMTFVLISSSATMASAVEAARQHKRRAAIRFITLTALGGLVFLGMQAFEWRHVIEAGARLSGNPWGDAAFGAYFFLLTGFHGTHVLTGVVVLLTTALRSAKGITTADGVELAGLYWHFVDLVWVFIFTLFYLV
jgi:cytochrome c oxidase subunit 3